MAKLILVRMQLRRGLEDRGRMSSQRLPYRETHTLDPRSHPRGRHCRPVCACRVHLCRQASRGAHRGEIHMRCNEPAVHQAKQARRHVLGPYRRGCMRITPCAALDDTFRARCFLLRSIIDFSKVVQALAFAVGGWQHFVKLAHRRPLANRPWGTA